MTVGRFTRTGRWRLAALACTLLLSAAWVPGTAASASDRRPIVHEAKRLVRAVALTGAADDDGLRFETSSHYRVDPAAAAVHVAVDVSVTNEVPNVFGTTYTSRSYFAEIGIPTLSEAVNLAATYAGGEPVPVEQETTESSLVSFAVVDLQPNLFFGDTQTFTLTYDLPNQAPRTPLFTRVTPGFVAVVPFPVGDAGLSSVEIVLPSSFDVTIEGAGGTLTRQRRGAEVAYVADAIPDPASWDAVLVGRDDDGLTLTEVELGEHDVAVEGWPDDPEWSAFVQTQVRDGLPVLEALIGRPLPMRRTLRITETVAPYVYGYAGWYSTDDNSIEIGDELDAHTVLHEISHVWFNDEVIAQRWIGEAFAEEYAARTTERLGQATLTPQPIDPAAPGAISLNAWSSPDLTDVTSDEREMYAYNAAFAVLRSVTDEIGIDALASTTQAMLDRTIAYRGDPEPETVRARVDWRRLLDLLRELGGSTTAEASFVAHVLAPGEEAVLAERAAARAELAALTAAGEGWTAPLAVRREMGSWDFTDATALMADARAVLATRAALDATIEPLGISSPPALEEAYESSDDLEALAATADRYRQAADDLVAADEAADRERGIFATIGLLGHDPAGEVRAGANHLEEGRVERAIGAAHAVEKLVHDADLEGKRRAAAVAAVAVMAYPALVGVRLVRRRRSSTGPAASMAGGVTERPSDWTDRRPGPDGGE